jgi:hypothetical protein
MGRNGGVDVESDGKVRGNGEGEAVPKTNKEEEEAF